MRIRVAMPITAVSLVLLLTGLSDDAFGEEIHALRFQAGGPLLTPPCIYVNWNDRLTFHNSGSTDATVRLLGVSNGSMDPNAENLVVPAGRTKSADTVFGWRPLPGTGTGGDLWINRLEVPYGVAVGSRVEPGEGSGGPCFPGLSSVVHGSLALPLYRSLIEPDLAQVHLRTDLGADESGLSAPSRINVGIYNAGSVAATASIELRCQSDDGLIDRRTVSVASNSIQQFGGLNNPRSGTACGGDGPLYPTYIVVSVDQPSLSYAITLSNELPPLIPISVGSQ